MPPLASGSSTNGSSVNVGPNSYYGLLGSNAKFGGVDFYTDAGKYVESRELGAGDVILLSAGGHGFEVLEEIEMVEVKQGPYAGDKDLRRIKGITAVQARIKKTGKALSGKR